MSELIQSRTITIIDSATNKRVAVNTDATTFGALKQAATAAGINIQGKDWLEGISKTPLNHDSSDAALLPTNVNYKGTVTNNLVYMLTNTNKKTQSGITRPELYAWVKKNNLQETIKSKFKANYTNVKTADLEKFYNKNNNAAKTTPVVTEEKVAPSKPSGFVVESKSFDTLTAKYNSLVDFVAKLIVDLKDSPAWPDIEIAKAELTKGGSATETPTVESPKEVDFSEGDFAEMFRK